MNTYNKILLNSYRIDIRKLKIVWSTKNLQKHIRLVEKNSKTLAYTPSFNRYNERTPIDGDHTLIRNNFLTL